MFSCDRMCSLVIECVLYIQGQMQCKECLCTSFLSFSILPPGSSSTLVHLLAWGDDKGLPSPPTLCPSPRVSRPPNTLSTWVSPPTHSLCVRGFLFHPLYVCLICVHTLFVSRSPCSRSGVMIRVSLPRISHVHVYVHMYMHVYMHMYMHLYMYMCMYMYVYMYMYMYMDMDMDMDMYKYIYIYTYVYTQIHRYTDTQIHSCHIIR